MGSPSLCVYVRVGAGVSTRVGGTRVGDTTWHMPYTCVCPPAWPQAHTATYRALKALPGGEAAQIGLVHHHITFKAQSNSVLNYVAA